MDWIFSATVIKLNFGGAQHATFSCIQRVYLWLVFANKGATQLEEMCGLFALSLSISSAHEPTWSAKSLIGNANERDTVSTLWQDVYDGAL